jgi:alpha-tubulin suppressor-like RCC1 family protein
MSCPLPKPIESLRDIKVDAVAAVAAGFRHTLALVDDGSVYPFGSEYEAGSGALGLGTSVIDAGVRVPTPQRVPGLRVVCGL